MEIPRDAARHLVGPNADYYVDRWALLDRRAARLGFNWPALLFGPLWMLYRRMYRTCGLWVGTVFLLSILEVLFASLLHIDAVPEVLDLAPRLAIGAACGVFGTYWYYLETRRRYRRLLGAEPPTPAALEAAGGVSRPAVWIGAVVTLAFLALSVLVALSDPPK